jgi:hypothetical protein
MATNFSENSDKNIQEFYCELCEYKCFRKQHIKQHFFSQKHKNRIFNNIEKSVNDTEQIKFNCECGKTYRDRSGLWKHKKKCEQIEKPQENLHNNIKFVSTQITPELIIKLIEQNKELQQTLIDQNKTIMDLAQKAGTNNSNINSNNNNKTFNLQFFLNETCKDAINLTDFVKQIQLSLNDLEETGKLGYAEGISKVFINNLNDIDYTQRPIHCSDSKRETLYIKEDNQWTKDDEQKTILTKAIKQVAGKNINQISEWQKIHPEYNDPESKQNDKYMQIVLNSMSGSTKEEADKNYEKIAKNIAKEVVINKTVT